MNEASAESTGDGVGWSLPQALWQYQQCRQFTDLTLYCEDGCVPAHRALLAGVLQLIGLEEAEEIEVECLVIPDVTVDQVKKALEEVYLTSKSEKLLMLLSCKNMKYEKVDIPLIEEIKPEGMSEDEDYTSNELIKEHVDTMVIKQEIFELATENQASKKKLVDPLNPLNAKNPSRPKHLERVKSLTCDQCGHIARDVGRLEKHKAFYHDNNHCCNHCEFKTNLRQELEAHLKVAHTDVKLKKQLEKKATKLGKLSCDQCDFVAKRPERLEGHKKREHGNRYYCDLCKSSYLDLEKLNLHKKTVHDTIHQCDQCSFQTNIKSNLTSHRNRHNNQLFYCDQCDFSSNNKSSVKSHVESKHEGKRFYCERCDYSAPYNGGFIRHIKMVHEGVTYQCEFCDHRATTNSNLKLHVDAKHLGIKYPCDQCSYQASRPGSLKIHKQTKHA